MLEVSCLVKIEGLKLGHPESTGQIESASGCLRFLYVFMFFISQCRWEKWEARIGCCRQYTLFEGFKANKMEAKSGSQQLASSFKLFDARYVQPTSKAVNPLNLWALLLCLSQSDLKTWPVIWAKSMAIKAQLGKLQWELVVVVEFQLIDLTMNLCEQNAPI